MKLLDFQFRDQLCELFLLQWFEVGQTRPNSNNNQPQVFINNPFLVYIKTVKDESRFN